MFGMPVLVTKEKIEKLTVNEGPKGKYIAKDGLNWLALNKDDECKPFVKTINVFDTFESAIKWLKK